MRAHVRMIAFVRKSTADFQKQPDTASPVGERSSLLTGSAFICRMPPFQLGLAKTTTISGTGYDECHVQMAPVPCPTGRSLAQAGAMIRGGTLPAKPTPNQGNKGDWEVCSSTIHWNSMEIRTPPLYWVGGFSSATSPTKTEPFKTWIRPHKVPQFGMDEPLTPG